MALAAERQVVRQRARGRLESRMFCGACGTENPEKNRYCVICRADLADQRQSMRVLRE